MTGYADLSIQWITIGTCASLMNQSSDYFTRLLMLCTALARRSPSGTGGTWDKKNKLLVCPDSTTKVIHDPNDEIVQRYEKGYLGEHQRQ
ncbi:hypothetical protein SNOG_10821 [Parastagonospora nodorum SN15]|uniref:Uncharacterized protein n=1 Tax=Phaeosphaeria nodorum (strain SN15 / ATCC MYA-4574 / FGSC 10173) TaxID=321614 RepID=Q0UBP3_PHANO|nr:hypothetical protein SNOG_10821 [Parastagonospora nodorum SN15]EAT82215.1 hypothetical protein SNOG_10821 [Parastagonospora nodorum SN15]